MHLLPGLVYNGSIPWIAPSESSAGFPKYSSVYLLPLLMKLIRNLLSFPAYHTWFLEEFVFASPPTDGFYRVRKYKRSRGNWRDKTYMENQKWSSCCSKECILIGLHLTLFTWISVPTSLLTGECHSWCVSVLWYSWDSSPSFRFGSNLLLDPKFGSLQVCWKNHGHKGRKPDK